jgi:ABC-type multidrug transport system ATPase subunit
VVFSTHTLGEAQRFAHRVLVLDDGELLFDGSPHEFMREAGAGDGSDGADLERALVVFLERRGR